MGYMGIYIATMPGPANWSFFMKLLHCIKIYNLISALKVVIATVIDLLNSSVKLYGQKRSQVGILVAFLTPFNSFLVFFLFAKYFPVLTLCCLNYP